MSYLTEGLQLLERIVDGESKYDAFHRMITAQRARCGTVVTGLYTQQEPRDWVAATRAAMGPEWDTLMSITLDFFFIWEINDTEYKTVVQALDARLAATMYGPDYVPNDRTTTVSSTCSLLLEYRWVLVLLLLEQI